ncbi:diacylglycerol kinase [Helicobacter monodelphidis]|uniref:diacylglycerol kinase n=1 Tax=Helicobacter sp. 15-1451 TaxID=2004995 RepID=UPI000DCB2D63|nr:diacylglycerol kinase [Helicobacter sp. 15-1451]RAX57034.1 diacylglycerol kinase [Helicobacter sp. 15-1451]
MNIQRNSKKGKRGFKRLFNAFLYSIDGFMAAFLEESGFRQVLLMSVILSIIAFFIALNWVHFTLLILPCFICIIVELFNSAIENAIDFVSLEFHPFAKRAKDMASCAQLFAITCTCIVWGSYIATTYFF